MPWSRPATAVGAAFEVKLGPKMVEEGARNLLRLAERVDQPRVGPPQRPRRDRGERIRLHQARRRGSRTDRGARTIGEGAVLCALVQAYARIERTP